MPAEMPTGTVDAASCAEVTYRYSTGDETVAALEDYSAKFAAGEVSAVVGPSGSGKSTLLRVLAGIDPPSSGHVYIGTTRLDRLSRKDRCRFRRRHIGYLFQAPSDNLISSLSAGGQMRHIAAVRQTPLMRQPSSLLRQVGLEQCLDRTPEQLSGGEQQRLAILCATLGGPALVLADEPTAQLDNASSADVLDLIEQLRTHGTTFIIASHDPLVIERATSVSILRQGVCHPARGAQL